jgi:MFS family permease
MFFFPGLVTFGQFVVGAAMVGFSYGACLSLFPSTAADRWGTKNLGLNYGILFTAWGVGGVVGPMLAGRIVDRTGSYAAAFEIAGGLMVVAFFVAALSYVSISFDVREREVKIRFGEGARRASVPVPKELEPA